MSLRTRLLLAFGAVVLLPLALLAFGLRQEMTQRVSHEYERRLDTLVEIISGDLERESAGIALRMASLKGALLNDNRFRLASVGDVESERTYLLEYAGAAMQLSGLSMLQIHDEDGRILSSGHFRNEHGRVEPGLAQALGQTPGGVALVAARAPHRDFVALARAESFVLAGRSFTIVGGMHIDDAFLGRLARDRDIAVSLVHPGGVLSSADAATPGARQTGPGMARVRELRVPVIRSTTGTRPEVMQATLLVTMPLTPLQALLRSVDSWFLIAAAGTGALALLLAVWLSARISRPLASLAEKTAVLDLDRLDVEFDEGTDEVGRLSRLLGDLATRLRASTARIREAERRATVGDLARQVNHDIRNGLIPIRNVMRHLAQVEREDPAAVAGVLAERRTTIESSIGYLETLASNYERLSQPSGRRACELNTLIGEVVRGLHGREAVDVRVDLAPDLPPVAADPVALRRILENLITNAVESLDGRAGRVTISTRTGAVGDAPAVRLTVADTGGGMSAEQSARIFDDFYTTKPGGTGLGLSIVRRLVMDLHGTLRVESAPGQGTRMVVEIPAQAVTR